jgi:hypothetical protein
MLKENEKHTEVVGTERQFLVPNWKNLLGKFNRLKNYKGDVKSLHGIQRMEVYTFSNFFDDRTFRLIATEY